MDERPSGRWRASAPAARTLFLEFLCFSPECRLASPSKCRDLTYLARKPGISFPDHLTRLLRNGGACISRFIELDKHVSEKPCR